MLNMFAANLEYRKRNTILNYIVGVGVWYLTPLSTIFQLYRNQWRIQDFKLGGGGGALKKLHREEGGAKNFGVFRVKNHDFTPKKIITFFQF